MVVVVDVVVVVKCVAATIIIVIVVVTVWSYLQHLNLHHTHCLLARFPT